MKEEIRLDDDKEHDTSQRRRMAAALYMAEEIEAWQLARDGAAN